MHLQQEGRRPERHHRTRNLADVRHRLPRRPFRRRGQKTDDARITVVWNGRKVHDNVAVDGPTGGGETETAAAGAVPRPGHREKGPLREPLIQTAAGGEKGTKLTTAAPVRGAPPRGPGGGPLGGE